MVSSTYITRVPSVRPRKTVSSAKSFKAARQRRPKGPRTLETKKRQQSFKRDSVQDAESPEVATPNRTQHQKKRKQSFKGKSGQDFESSEVSKPSSTYRWCRKTKSQPFHPTGSRVLRARSSKSKRDAKKQFKLRYLSTEGSWDGLDNSDSDEHFVDDSSSASDEEELAPLPIPPPRSSSIRKPHDSEDSGIEEISGLKKVLKSVDEKHERYEDEYMTAVSESCIDQFQGESPDYDVPPTRGPILPPKKSKQDGVSKMSGTSTMFDENEKSRINEKDPQQPILPPKSYKKDEIMRTNTSHLMAKSSLRESTEFQAASMAASNGDRRNQSSHQLSLNEHTSGLQSVADQAQASIKIQPPPPPKCGQKYANQPLTDLKEHEEIQHTKKQVPILPPKRSNKDEKTLLTILESDESDKDDFFQMSNLDIMHPTKGNIFHTHMPLPKPCHLPPEKVMEDTDTESSSDDLLSENTNMFGQKRFGSCRVRVLPNLIPNLHQLKSVKRDKASPLSDASQPRQSVVLKHVPSSVITQKGSLNTKPKPFNSMSKGNKLRSSRRSSKGKIWNQNDEVQSNSLCIDKSIIDDCDLYLNHTTITRQETICRYLESERPKPRRRKSIKSVKDRPSPASLDNVSETTEVFQKHRTSPLGLGLSFRSSQRLSTLPEMKIESFGNVTGQSSEEMYKVPNVTQDQNHGLQLQSKKFKQPWKQNLKMNESELETSDTNSFSEDDFTSDNGVGIKSKPGWCSVRKSNRQARIEKGQLEIRADDGSRLCRRRQKKLLKDDNSGKTDALSMRTSGKSGRKPARGRSIEIADNDNEMDDLDKSSIRTSGISSLGVAPSVPPRDYVTNISTEDFNENSMDKSNRGWKSSDDVDYLEPSQVIHLPRKKRPRSHRYGQFSCVVKVIRSCVAISRLYNRLRNICRHRFVR